MTCSKLTCNLIFRRPTSLHSLTVKEFDFGKYFCIRHTRHLGLQLQAKLNLCKTSPDYKTSGRTIQRCQHTPRQEMPISSPTAQFNVEPTINQLIRRGKHETNKANGVNGCRKHSNKIETEGRQNLPFITFQEISKFVGRKHKPTTSPAPLPATAE